MRRGPAEDGVVYAEVRYAPEQHLRAGSARRGRRGLSTRASGRASGAAGGRPPHPRRRLLTAMRHAARALEIAELANRHRDLGVVGFDIAGAEAGYPPTSAPGRLRVPQAGEQPTDQDPRREASRAAVHLAGNLQ
ncbi:hypothetical protein LV779_21560 [Streptomyces thinghirensis]|nr:hypothetical protein [Streptomyces thinghirensis]